MPSVNKHCVIRHLNEDGVSDVYGVSGLVYLDDGVVCPCVVIVENLRWFASAQQNDHQEKADSECEESKDVMFEMLAHEE